MGSELGLSDEKILAVADYSTSSLFSETEKLALEVADAMTITGRDVTDGLFEKLQAVLDSDQIVELMVTIAWENSSSKFNRALRVPSQNFWKPKTPNADPSLARESDENL